MKQIEISKMSLIPDSLQMALNAMKDSPSWMALQEIRAMTNDLPLAQIQKELAQVHQMQPYIDSALSIKRQVEAVYGPLQDIAKNITTITAEWSAALQASKALQGIPQLELSELSKISTTVQSYFSDIQPLLADLSDEALRDYCKDGEITPDTVAETVEAICTEASEAGKLTIPDRIDKIKRTNWFFALTIVFMILSFLGKPAIDRVKDGALESLGITELWEQSGIFEWIDQLFGVSAENSAVSEDIAKAAVKGPVGNLSKAKREELLSKISAIRTYISTAPQDENTGKLLTYLSDLEKDVNGKKYGLVFEEHREAIDEVLDAYTPVLTEEKARFIDHGGEMNFLLEGDNLAALKLLEKTHLGKIDLIYIDPPYNTGNEDFIYNDCYVDIEDSFRHSKWSSFMKKRLEIAHSLLAEDGVLFIQISDIELAQLRLLCDKVFGEENFLNIVSVNMKNIAGASGGGEDKRLKKNCEYILIYAKNYDFLPVFNGAFEYEKVSSMVERYRDEEISWKYTSALVDPGQKVYVASTADGDGNEIKIYKRVNYQIQSINQIMKNEQISEEEAYDKYAYCIFQTAMPQSSIRPRVMQKVNEIGIESDLYSIEYIPKTGKNKGILYEQFYKGTSFRLFAWLRDVTETIDGVLYKKTLQGTYWDYVAGTKNLTKEGNVEFGNGKKPVDLLKRIISLYPKKDALVLDFFAGSATTGHAVISQNLDDAGARHFILCTNNQNGICIEKAYRRLANVINGYTNDKGKYFKPMPASLKYYRIEYIPISERVYYEYADELLRHVRELVELENGINFTGNAEIAIVLTDGEMEDFTAHVEQYERCRTLYLGHDILPTGKQEKVLKEKDIQVRIIPDYYYRELEG